MTLEMKETPMVCQQYPAFLTILTAWIFDDTSFSLNSLAESITIFFPTVGKKLADFKLMFPFFSKQ